METLFLTLDTIAAMVVIYFSYRSEKSPDEPETGPFRLKVFKRADEAPRTADLRRSPRHGR